MNNLDEQADTQPLLRAYLRDLDAALAGLPRGRRKQLVGEIRQHVNQALAEQPSQSPAELRSLLDRVGQPEEIAAAALEEQPGRPQPVRTLEKVMIAGVSILLVAGLGTGLALAVWSPWSARSPAAATPGSSHPGVAPARSPARSAAAARPSAAQSTAPAAGQPSAPPATGTSALRAILPPATVVPVSNECTQQLTFDADGDATPLTCTGSGVNTLAWHWFAYGEGNTLQNSELLALGPYASPGQVYEAMCYDYANVYKTKPITESAEQIAEAYYGWQFGVDPLSDFEQAGCPHS